MVSTGHPLAQPRGCPQLCFIAAATGLSGGSGHILHVHLGALSRGCRIQQAALLNTIPSTGSANAHPSLQRSSSPFFPLSFGNAYIPLPFFLLPAPKV